MTERPVNPLSLRDIEVERLRVHLTQIIYSLLSEVTSDGVVLSRREDGTVFADLPASHHLVDLLCRLDRRVFNHYVGAIARWFADPENAALDTQFAADVLVEAAPSDPKVLELLDRTILPTQLDSGAFTRYTAYLHGGDYFSTLWCVRVLLNADTTRYNAAISRAMDYLLTNALDSAIPAPHIGFLLLLMIRRGASDVNDTLVKKVVSALAARGEGRLDLVSRLYLVEDLFAVRPWAYGDAESLQLVRDEIVEAFSLGSEADELPLALQSMKDRATESVMLQAMACACKIGILACSEEDRAEVAYDVNGLLHSRGRHAVYLALQRDRELKEFLRRYGNIHLKFHHYDAKLGEIWKSSPFEKTLFIMMPFRDDVRFNTISTCIKAACEERGFKAIRVDDADRRFSERLWDNLVINMLSCGSAVAVYVSDEVVDVRQPRDDPYIFTNPNVALEFGFFQSRGQEVLLLRDARSSLPSDLQGFLWHPFNVNNPEAGVRQGINKFLDVLEQNREAETSAIQAD